MTATTLRREILGGAAVNMAAEVVVQLNWVRVYCQYNQTSTEPHNKPYNVPRMHDKQPWPRSHARCGTHANLVFFVTKPRRTDGKPAPHPSRRALTTNLDERIGSERRPRARHGATSRQH